MARGKLTWHIFCFWYGAGMHFRTDGKPGYAGSETYRRYLLEAVQDKRESEARTSAASTLAHIRHITAPQLALLDVVVGASVCHGVSDCCSPSS